MKQKDLLESAPAAPASNGIEANAALGLGAHQEESAIQQIESGEDVVMLTPIEN